MPFAAAEIFQGLLYGYLGIIVYMILTGCGLPMPEEVAIIAGAALAASNKLDWRLTLGSLLIGALVGDCVMYYIGYHFGRRLLTHNRVWKRLITPEREKKVEELLAKHGVKVLLVARFLVGLRGPMYITAGILKVPFQRFLLADLFCATLVVSLFYGLTYMYGAQIMHIIHNGEGWLSIVVVTVAIIGAGVGVWFYLRNKKKQPGTSDGSLSSDILAASADLLPGTPPMLDNGQPHSSGMSDSQSRATEGKAK